MLRLRVTSPSPSIRYIATRDKEPAPVPAACPPIPPEVIACLAHGRAPTVREVEDVAARIWAESAGERSAFVWGELEAGSRERVVALRAAVVALNGSGEAERR